ncbi:glycosyltransferase family 4 protein [Hippea jasoniae]|uniref:glycosyltransferase family 4 protein n=1 Tax=Hippea jasoniae TaxID=944479 RepID=UPI000557E894|nr:glycosyltransferase family 4 protein [Hippea jasoniae]
MRIAIFYKYFRKYGGQEKVIYNLAYFLAKKGFDIEVYAKKIFDQPEDGRIKINRVFVPFGGSVGVLWFALYSFFKAKSLKKRYSDICILGFGKTFYQDIYRSGGGVHKFYFERAKKKYSTKIGRLFYTFKKKILPYHWTVRFIEYLTFKNPDLKAVIVPSEFVKKQIVDIFGFNENKIVIIRNGVDLSRFKPDEKKAIELKDKIGAKDKFVLSFVSTNHRLKGLEYLLKALRLLIDQGINNFKLVVAGSGDEPYFKKLIKKLGLDDYVIIYGRIKDVEKIYQMSDVFVYPTLFDTSALVVLEAMACSCIPVVSRYCGSSEIIENGRNGFIIHEPDKPHEIATLLKPILQRQINIDQIKQQAIKSLQKFELSGGFEKIEKLILDKCFTD